MMDHSNDRMNHKAVFIDKDGTLIHDVPYNVDPERIRFHDDAFESLKLLKAHGYLLIMVSNQSGIARGFFDLKDLETMWDNMQAVLQRMGIPLDGFYFCPHHPCGIVDKYAIHCRCRKPAPGMLWQAAYDYGIGLSDSWMIGDILNDVEAGHRAGCQSILINNGSETEWLDGDYRKPVYVVDSLYDAVLKIVHTNKLNDHHTVAGFNRLM